jgi:hypothetical protein
MMAGGRFDRSFGLPFLPPAAKAGMAALPVGRKGGAEVRHDLREGQGGDSGEDERLGFGVGFDLGRTARAMGGAVLGLQCLAALPGVQGRLRLIVSRRVV